MADTPIVGIDLGTTNSCAAVVKDGKPFVIPSREGYNTVPSVVALSSKGKLLVGHPAKGQMLTNPRQTVYGSKRLVGRPFDSQVVRMVKDRFHYEIVEGPGGEAAVRLGETVHTLQQISAMVLKEVKAIAEAHLEQPLDRAVITCPAYYNDNQRQAVRDAGALAGLKVERVLNEPTAAALAFGFGRERSERVLVYDLGGGTFDASLLELQGNVYEVLSTGGDTFLGGVDFDGQVVDFLLSAFHEKAGVPFQGDRVAMQRIADAAERAKCALSEQREVRVHVPFVTLLNDQPYDLDVTITREQLHALTSGLVERSLKVCEEVLAAKGMAPKDVGGVLLVGGQSRMPLVRERIEAFFGKLPLKGVHPDEAVATGAALLAHSLHAVEGVVLIDVLPMSIGVGLPGGRFRPLISRNTTLPHAKSYALTTTRDNQTEFELSIYQGDQPTLDGNEFLGNVKLSGLPKGPKRSVEIAVTFNVSAENQLTVTATERKRGRTVTASFDTRKSGQSKAAGQDAESAGPGGAPPASPSAPIAPPAAGAPRAGGFWGFVKRLFG